MNRSILKTAALLGAVAAALSATACSSDDDSSEVGDTVNPTPGDKTGEAQDAIITAIGPVTVSNCIARAMFDVQSLNQAIDTIAVQNLNHSANASDAVHLQVYQVAEDGSLARVQTQAISASDLQKSLASATTETATNSSTAATTDEAAQASDAIHSVSQRGSASATHRYSANQASRSASTSAAAATQNTNTATRAAHRADAFHSTAASADQAALARNDAHVNASNFSNVNAANNSASSASSFGFPFWPVSNFGQFGSFASQNASNAANQNQALSDLLRAAANSAAVDRASERVIDQTASTTSNATTSRASNSASDASEVNELTADTANNALLTVTEDTLTSSSKAASTSAMQAAATHSITSRQDALDVVRSSNSTLSDSQTLDQTSVALLDDAMSNHFVVEASFNANQNSSNLNVLAGSQGSLLGQQTFINSFNGCMGW